MLNDHGFQYGAGIAHLRIAGAFDLAGHHVSCFSLLSSHEKGFSDIIAKVCEYQPDIVLFGNTHGVDRESVSVLERLSQLFPCYWLTHDFWLLTGRCAYPSDCDKFFTSGCDAACPSAAEYPQIPLTHIEKAWNHKWAFLNKTNRLTVLANSEWAAERYRHAFAKRGIALPVETIRLGVPTEYFYPREKPQSRRAMGIVEDGPVLTFSATSISDYQNVKGGHIVLATIERLATEFEQLTVIMIGRCERPFELPPNVTSVYLGYTDDVDTIAQAYSAADVYLGPSLEETFGQVFVEAAMCGTPAIAFANSGARDAIVADITGILVAEVSSEAFYQTTLQLLRDARKLNALSVSASDCAREVFSLQASYKSFHEVFERHGMLDRSVMPDQVRLAERSELIKHAITCRSERNVFKRSVDAVRRSVVSLIERLPTDFTGKVRALLPARLERWIMRWLSGWKY